MKKIYLNLKRFDVPSDMGGVNRLAPIDRWGAYIVEKTQDTLSEYDPDEVSFTMFFPEAHIIGASAARKPGSSLKIGPQGVYGEDTAPGAAFGAFTTQRSANAMKAAGCESVLIGHCEERQDKLGIMSEAGCGDTAAVNRILNREVKAALAAGLEVLYCIGENGSEQDRWKEVLGEQLETGLRGTDKSRITIAYEPVWAVGPGKTPPDGEYIQRTAEYIKDVTGGMDVVYGGGLKKDNAAMVASVKSIDGGLIALTRFDGEIGFYPDEYLEIIRLYMGH